jgi:hypothetical protein
MELNADWRQAHQLYEVCAGNDESKTKADHRRAEEANYTDEYPTDRDDPSQFPRHLSSDQLLHRLEWAHAALLLPAQVRRLQCSPQLRQSSPRSLHASSPLRAMRCDETLKHISYERDPDLSRSGVDNRDMGLLTWHDWLSYVRVNPLLAMAFDVHPDAATLYVTGQEHCRACEDFPASRNAKSPWATLTSGLGDAAATEAQRRLAKLLGALRLCAKAGPSTSNNSEKKHAPNCPNSWQTLDLGAFADTSFVDCDELAKQLELDALKSPPAYVPPPASCCIVS